MKNAMRLKLFKRASKYALFPLAIIVIISVILKGYSYGDRDLCSPNSPDFDAIKKGTGYEIINLVDREVWATSNWTPKEFAGFSFPIIWSLWFKNDPRIPLADGGQFTRSPGCEDGQYNYMKAFDRRFFQVVRLIKINRSLDDQDLIRKTELEKYHIVRYSPGRTVSILRSPTGKRYIGVSRSLDRSTDTPTLPEGWTVKEVVLTEELRIYLSGNVDVLRLDNEDSYQGPLPEDLRILTVFSELKKDRY